MKKAKISALILSAVIVLTPTFGCRHTRKPAANSESSISKYADNPEIGQNKIDVSLNEDTNVNKTSYKINRIIDSGRRKDGLKYIYLDVTIKNESDTDYEASGLNNFYLILDDGTEILTDVRADIYAKQSLTGYEQLLSVPAGSEYTGYIGFCINENINNFTVGFFATADNNDKSNVVLCTVKPEDIVPAPEGLFVESNESEAN